jgi:hypothetical protein
MCIICGQPKAQRHHVFPKRWFGKGIRVLLCQKHHREIEKDIWEIETNNGKRERIKLFRQYYFDAVVNLIRRNCATTTVH